MKKDEKFIIFSDETACPVMPKETVEQKAAWNKEKAALVKEYATLFPSEKYNRQEAVSV